MTAESGSGASRPSSREAIFATWNIRLRTIVVAALLTSPPLLGAAALGVVGADVGGLFSRYAKPTPEVVAGGVAGVLVCFLVVGIGWWLRWAARKRQQAPPPDVK